jgi:hypothetical protein
MFLKRKRCGKIKGRGCADGRPQRAYIPREDTTSPTVSTQAMFITCLIDAYEGRDVATVDIPGAFMQADMDDLVHLRLTGQMVDLLLDIDQDKYATFVTQEGKEKVIYVELIKALYGTLKAAKLFWLLLSGKLQEWGFEINGYDSCVANKIIDGRQCTIIWHVDDLKISHVETKVVDDVITLLEREFGKEAPLTVQRGRVHDYLGMCLDFSSPGKLVVSMESYIKSMIEEMPNDMIGTAVTPAAPHLFTVNTINPDFLTESDAEVFVHMVMQLLYLSQRARPDIRTAVSFLCTRLRKPDLDDYKKLARVMKYLQGTVDLPLILSSDGSGMLAWWVDASYAVHPDMKGHTGGVLSMGQGAVYSTSTRQKLVTRSSTESELVGIHDVMPDILWTKHFLEAQGFPVTENVLHQDNQSCILLAKNGRQSSSKRTKHLHLRYFFVKDKVDSGDIVIRYCPTENMRADFFTKPLQGSPFRVHRDFIMNIDPAYYDADHRSVLKSEGQGHANAEPARQGKTDDSDDPTPYRTALLRGVEAALRVADDP